MARLKDQFTGRDVSFWAVTAVALWAVAGISGGLALAVPGWVLSGLHSSRMEGASIDQLRGQMAELRSKAVELQQSNDVLAQRLSLSELQSGEVTRRVGALEITVPKLVEAVNTPEGVDRDSVTATAGPAPITFDADGGSVSYTTTPLGNATGTTAAPSAQPMPRALPRVSPDPGAYGIALGPPIDATAGTTAWQSLNARAGTLLVGLGPVLGHIEGGSARRIVAGPLASEAEARELCGRMAQAGIACASVPFVGDPLN